MTFTKLYKKNKKPGVIKLAIAEEANKHFLTLLSKKQSTVKLTIKHILAYKYYSGDHMGKKRNAYRLLVGKNVRK
jgi:hypothetical protein